jgi:hypothetical protein
MRAGCVPIRSRDDFGFCSRDRMPEHVTQLPDETQRSALGCSAQGKPMKRFSPAFIAAWRAG